jgi:RNA polymerase sigma factor (sigma-70 family)
MTDFSEPPDEPGRPSPTVASGAHRRPTVGPPTVDVAIFSAFYRAETKDLVNFLLWMGASIADATDIAQDTMIEAYRAWPSIRHPRAWIRRVASRGYARHHLKPDETTTGLIDNDHSGLLAAHRDLAEWEQQHDILRLLATLPWRQRQVMAWSLDGYQPQEIAAELNISSDAVRSSLKLARRALAARIGEAGGPS